MSAGRKRTPTASLGPTSSTEPQATRRLPHAVRQQCGRKKRRPAASPPPPAAGLSRRIFILRPGRRSSMKRFRSVGRFARPHAGQDKTPPLGPLTAEEAPVSGDTPPERKLFRHETSAAFVSPRLRKPDLTLRRSAAELPEPRPIHPRPQTSPCKCSGPCDPSAANPSAGAIAYGARTSSLRRPAQQPAPAKAPQKRKLPRPPVKAFPETSANLTLQMFRTLRPFRRKPLGRGHRIRRTHILSPTAGPAARTREGRACGNSGSAAAPARPEQSATT